MKYQKHWHILSHLVQQHHSRPTSHFQFSEHVPLNEQTIEDSHRKRLLDELQEELVAMKALLQNIPAGTHKRDVYEKKIEYLSSVISEKKN